MEFYNLGKVPWKESQLLYHALAALDREALVFLSPATPYVCIGYHQDIEAEVDLDYCKSRHIPVFRREVGGGAVYLDGDQLFFQMIIAPNSSRVPAHKGAFYRKFLQPVINTYRRIGIPVQYKPINDLIVNQRKISGTGVGEIENSLVFVGNLILDFEYDTMVRILKLSDEKLRDKVYKTMRDNLTTIRRELGETSSRQWDEQRLNNIMAEEFQKILDPFVAKKTIDNEVVAKISELNAKMLNPAWLYQKGRFYMGNEVKIRAGITVKRKEHKATGGLIRVLFELHDNQLKNISISGDFFCYPHDALHRFIAMLEDTYLDDLSTVVDEFYSDPTIETPGIGVNDWLSVFKDQ